MYYVNLNLKGYKSPDGTLQSDFGILANGNGGVQSDVGLVRNLQGGNYWSGTLYGAAPNFAWYFSTDTGGPGGNNRGTDALDAWAVRDGDVQSGRYVFTGYHPHGLPQPAVEPPHNLK
jgi:hypothetical protein